MVLLRYRENSGIVWTALNSNFRATHAFDSQLVIFFLINIFLIKEAYVTFEVRSGYNTSLHCAVRFSEEDIKETNARGAV